jgi:hypothetical protein
MSDSTDAAPPSRTPTTKAPKAGAPVDLLVFNEHRGIRQVTHSERGEGVDAQGHPRHKLTTFALLPGLNLVPLEAATKLEASINGTDGLKIYPDGIDAMHPSSAGVLIQATGTVEVLQTLALRCKSEKIQALLAAQITKMTTGNVAKVKAREAQAAHTPRG